MNPNKNRSVSRSGSPTSPRPAVNTWGLCVNGSNTVTPDIIVNHRRTVLCQLVSLISVPNTNPLFVSARPNRETPSDTSHFHIAGERSNTSSPRLVISKSTREAFHSNASEDLSTCHSNNTSVGHSISLDRLHLYHSG